MAFIVLLYYVFIVWNSRVEILLLLNKKNVGSCICNLLFVVMLPCHTQIRGGKPFLKTQSDSINGG